MPKKKAAMSIHDREHRAVPTSDDESALGRCHIGGPPISGSERKNTDAGEAGDGPSIFYLQSRC